MENLKTIRADSMAEALARVKRLLGNDAVILHTRTFRRGGLMGLGGRNVVEITAAKSVADLPVTLRRGMVPQVRGHAQEVVQARDRKGQGRAEGAAESMLTVKDTPPTAATRRMVAEVGELKSLVHKLVRQTRPVPPPLLPEELLDTYTSLVRNEVAEEIASRLVDHIRRGLTGAALRDRVALRRKLAGYVEQMLPQVGGIEPGSPGGPKIVALVGPTGVGKTTTAAKLAAHFRLRREKRVSLITTDTYRLAGAEQLRAYAEIIDVPLQVVRAPQEMPAAVAATRNCDVVLIDTAGRGPSDDVGLQELRCCLAEVPSREVHLVLSATSGRRALEEVVEKFAFLGVDRVIFTKLDEAVGFGALLTCLEKAEARLSYVTTGQGVPSDIEAGGARRIAAAIVESGVDRE